MKRLTKQVQNPTQRLSSQNLQLQDAVRQFFIQLGENPDRDGIKETPKRFIAWAKEKKSFRIRAGIYEKIDPLKNFF